MRGLVRIVTFAGLALLFAACPGARERPFGSPRPPGPGGDAGTSTPTDGGFLTDGGGPGGNAGVVLIRQTRADGIITVVGAFAASTTEQLANGLVPGLCSEIASDNSCTLMRCDGTPAAVEVGTISVITPGGVIEISDTFGGIYSFSDMTGTYAFDTNDVITFSGSGGGEIGEFSGSVSAPNPPNATLPSGTIPANQPLTVTWTAGGIANEAFFTIANGSSTVACRTPAANGSVTVSPDFLGALAGDASAVLSYRTSQTIDAAGTAVVIGAEDAVSASVFIQ